MEQLSGFDTYWLDAERGNLYHHVAALGIYDPSSAPGGKVRFKDLLRYFSAQVERHPILRKRLATVPFGLDRPYWIDDPDLDIEFHVRHIALPQPGDWRQLMIQVARIHSRRLDRSRPMWEIYVIEGLDRIPNLPKGSFALFLKFHHAAIDGEAGVELLKAIHSPAPDADASESRQALYAERDPTSVELYSRALAHGAVRAVQLSSVGVAGLARVARAGVNRVLRRRAADRDEAWLPPFVKAPPTRFNRQVSANRVVDAVALPLDALKRAQAKLGDVSINDLFLAVVGGALRRYLGSKDELPDRTLTALMPLGTRADAPAGVSTHVDGMPVALHTEIADPVERVRAVRRDADAAKRSARAIGRGLVHALVDALPQVAIEKIVRHYVVPQLNVTVSNIRGPDATLYVAGARLVHFYPVSIATDYVGLNHTGFSYNGVLWISAVACRNMLPDPGFYADCLRESFDELIAAADAAVPLARPRPVAATRRGRRAAVGAKPPAAHGSPQTAVRRTARRAT